MSGLKLRRLGMFTLPVAALAFVAAGTASAAAYPFAPFTFDNATQATFVPSATYTYNSYSIATPNFRIDYTTNVSAATTSFDAAQDHTGNGGGSIEMTQTVKTAGSPTNVGFVMDIAPDANGGTGVAAIGYSFWVEVVPGSATSIPGGGPGYPAGSDGYFQSYYHTQPGYSGVYSADISIDGKDLGNGAGFNFGDPNYTGVSDAGTWHFIQVNLGGVVPNLAAIGFQDYLNNAVGDVNFNAGDKIEYAIDDVNVIPAPVPEPATLSLLALGLPAMLVRRRAKVS